MLKRLSIQKERQDYNKKWKDNAKTIMKKNKQM